MIWRRRRAVGSVKLHRHQAVVKDLENSRRQYHQVTIQTLDNISAFLWQFPKFRRDRQSAFVIEGVMVLV